MIQSPHSKLPLLLSSVDSWSILPEWTLYSFTFQICLIIVCVSLIVCSILLKRNFFCCRPKSCPVPSHREKFCDSNSTTDSKGRKKDWLHERKQPEKAGEQTLRAAESRGWWERAEEQYSKQGRRVCFYHKQSSQSQQWNRGFVPPKIIHVACTLIQFYWRDANRKKKKKFASYCLLKSSMWLVFFLPH